MVKINSQKSLSVISGLSLSLLCFSSQPFQPLYTFPVHPVRKLEPFIWLKSGFCCKQSNTKDIFIFQIKQEGYEFPVYLTKFCPRNKTEWKERAKVLNCTEQRGYTCLPNEHFTELLEFCYTDPWILIEEGKIASCCIILYIIKYVNKNFILYWDCLKKN